MKCEVTNEWEGQNAFIIGGGSSLKNFNFDSLKGKNTIGANEAFRLGAEICKVCIFSDPSWFQRVKWDLQKYKGRVYSVCSNLPLNVPWIITLRRVQHGLHHGEALGWNFSSGAAAVNLALNLGAKNIYLLGFDMLPIEGKTHWHSNYGKPTKDTSFLRFIRGFENVSNSIKKYPVQIYNVTDGSSRLPFFPKIDFQQLQEVLRCP